MAGNQYCELKNRKLIEVGGGDAFEFLQGILTCNLDTIKSEGAGFGGLLTPQGKVLFDFLIIYRNGVFLLDTIDDLADDLIRRLTFYRLRADVSLEMKDDLKVFAHWGVAPENRDEAILIADPRLEKMGWREYSSSPTDSGDEQTIENYQTHRISLGVPEGVSDYAYGETFPHEALFDQMGGLDFAKGCYVGQEVISRIHHRGTARKRIIQISAENDLPAAGAKITAGQKAIGELRSTAGKTGLAILRLDRTHDAIESGQEIYVEEMKASVQIQPWASFDWPKE